MLNTHLGNTHGNNNVLEFFVELAKTQIENRYPFKQCEFRNIKKSLTHIRVRKAAKIRNRYNQVPHPT